MGRNTIATAIALVGTAICAVTVQAADHYVSPSGTSTWAACVNAGTPCSPAVAMASAQAGDTTYFRGGIYRVGQHTGWPWAFELQPKNSGAPGKPITFKAYPGEVPVIDARVVDPNENSACFGAVGTDYIEWDGFSCQANGGARMGSVLLYSTTGSIVRNTVINGGTTAITSTDNKDCIRIEKSSDVRISNSRVHSFNQVSNWPNTAAVKLYHNQRVVIENSEFEDGTCALFLKSDQDDCVLRNNFIHDVHRAIYVTTSAESMQSDRGRVYDNVIANVRYAGFESDSNNTTYHGDDWEIHNNTFYNTSSASATSGYGFRVSSNQPGHGWKIYSNISVNQAEDLVAVGSATLEAEDHNQWGPGPVKWVVGRYGSNPATYTSLSAWQASGKLEGGRNPGVGDLVSDPQFVNASGSFSLKTDFVLAASSPCRRAGRDGVDMGALNIESSEGYVDAPAPSPPKGVTLR